MWQLKNKTSYFIFPETPSGLFLKCYLMNRLQGMKLAINVSKQSVRYPIIKIFIIILHVSCIKSVSCDYESYVLFRK